MQSTDNSKRERKSQLRSELRSRLKNLNNSELITSEKLINEHLLNLMIKLIKNPPLDKKSAILSYQSFFHGEIDLRPSLNKIPRGIDIFLPSMTNSNQIKFKKDNQNYTSGKFGILESKSSQFFNANSYNYVIALIPGLGFSPSGNRLGRGLGAYDHFLSALPKSLTVVKIGICLNCQVLVEIPTEIHDQKVDYFLTETGLIKTTQLF